MDLRVDLKGIGLKSRVLDSREELRRYRGERNPGSRQRGPIFDAHFRDKDELQISGIHAMLQLVQSGMKRSPTTTVMGSLEFSER
jgi:hypothetical protein